MKTETAIEQYKSPYERMRKLLIEMGVTDYNTRLAVADLLHVLMQEKWDDGFSKADQIHREMNKLFNK